MTAERKSATDEDVQLSVRVRSIPKVVLETCKPTLEAGRVLLRQARAADSGSALLVGARGGCLLGYVAQHHRRDRAGSQIRFAVDALELEEASDATVELLCQGTHLSRAYDAHEAGLLEDLQVVTDRSLRHVQSSGEFRRARRTLAEEPDDPAAGEVTKCAELLRVLDDKDVVELVVGGTVDDRGTYGNSRPFAREERVGPRYARPDPLVAQLRARATSPRPLPVPEAASTPSRARRDPARR